MAQKIKQALLIGPSYGQDLPDFCRPLYGVHTDVLLMKDMFIRNGFLLENIQVLEGDVASKDNILSSLEELSSNVPRESVVIIYFSGHGYQLKEEFDQGLIPGGLTKEMFNEYLINDVCITGEQFKPHLLKLMEKECVVNTIFDCCFSGRLYRGFMEKEGPPPIPKQLNLSKEYVEKYCEILNSRSPRKPVEHVNTKTSIAVNESLLDEPIPSTPIQEEQPPNPMQHSGVLLQYPKQEFWTSQGWTPSQFDKFIHIAACASNEQAFEDPDPSKPCGRLTSALVEILDEVQKENKKVNYNILKSLIKQKFAEKGHCGQTPQFEGGNMDLVVFDFFDTVSQPRAFEICKVISKYGSKEVVLNAGKLHGVVDGEYDVYGPHVTDEEVDLNATGSLEIGQVEVMAENIHMLKSFGKVLCKGDAREIKVGCKAVLRRRHSMCTSVFVKCSDSRVEQCKNKLKQEIENQGMFAIEQEETLHCVTLDVRIVEEKNCWQACQYGRMIVPYQEFGDEKLMMKNLSKYFRHKFAISPKCSDSNMLKNVSFEVFKIKEVPSFKGSTDKKNELINEAIKTCDLYSKLPSNEVPTFRAHRVELVTDVLNCHRKKYKVVDKSGDALVIQITNNETFAIHVCVMSYQADGSIVVLHPPKNGNTEVLSPRETAQAIKRIFVEPQTVRRMAEPDFDKPKPKCCEDILILYATKVETDYKPLTQTAIDLCAGLSTRGHNPPDRKLLHSLSEFRDALGSTCSTTRSDRDGFHDPRWLTIRRDVRILCNED